MTPIRLDAAEIEAYRRINSDSGYEHRKQEEALVKKLELRKSMGMDLEVVEEELKQLRESRSNIE